jgi:hypothetical protein
MIRGRPIRTMLVALALLSGCASAPEVPPASGGVTYRDDEKLQKVWLAPGFQFGGYDTLYITDTRADVPRVNPDGVESLEWSRGIVQNEIAAAIQAKKFFRAVVNREADIPPGSRVIRLDNTIIEYEKGGGAARYFAGLYGAGQPVIKVRGRMAEGDRPLFAFETRRSGTSVSARLVGHFRSDRSIQEDDIRDLAEKLADFIVQTAKGQAQ